MAGEYLYLMGRPGWVKQIKHLVRTEMRNQYCTCTVCEQHRFRMALRKDYLVRGLSRQMGMSPNASLVLNVLY